MKKIAVVVGARPQFIKLAPLVEVLSDKVDLLLVHTGQHYDFEMSDIFFDQLNLPKIDYHLGVGSAGQSTQTGKMMVGLEEVFRKESPDMVVVIGDTNSTLAGTLAAAQNFIPLTHIEAGLRSKNNHMPEQINRIVADRLSDILCCPTEGSVSNLKAEGQTSGIFLTGDILYDLVARINPSDEFTDSILKKYDLAKGEYIFMTTHRAENVDNPDYLKSLVLGLKKIKQKIFLPLHPRTEKNLKRSQLYETITDLPGIQISKPIGIVESLALTKSSLGVITDSGGLQREAAYFGKRAYILRDETEWQELSQYGAVICIDSNLDKKSLAWDSAVVPSEYFKSASKNIADAIFSMA
ncbi:MAG: UDP-N-acetylglucosamine 2-epimerase (non-hydrolyzing) [candidate division Zixibacteria bacterium]|nr:UDP-N-acetylglucosamine 2-epimerase (non-hydrolyzing) [candidate division Zixibacteria bacterium]